MNVHFIFYDFHKQGYDFLLFWMIETRNCYHNSVKDFGGKIILSTEIKRTNQMSLFAREKKE